MDIGEGGALQAMPATGAVPGVLSGLTLAALPGPPPGEGERDPPAEGPIQNLLLASSPTEDESWLPRMPRAARLGSIE